MAVETRPTIEDGAHLYDADFYQWCMTMAELLRRRLFEEVDIEHVAEEIEDLGKSQSHEIGKRVRVIVVHLLKLRYQPLKKTRSWEKTIGTQRIEIEEVLQDNPSLRRTLTQVPAQIYNVALRIAALETGLSRDTFPSECPFTPQEIFGEELLAAE